MPPTALSFVPQTYAELRRAVELTMVRGQQAVEQAKVRTYWETGRLINEHVLLFKERADYGAGTIQRLASDLKVHRSVLQRCVQFAQAIPNCATWRNLTWAHYRVLIPVADSKERRALASEANRNAWPVARLEQRLRALAPPPAAEVSTVAADNRPPVRLLTPKRGMPGVCKVIADGDGVAVDLGFACYLRPPATNGPKAGPSTELKTGDFVRVNVAGVEPVRDATKADLFTYSAEILKVVDGDTLWVRTFLRPDQWVKQKLRLRDLDCPEIDTAEGKAAKRFTESLVARATGVTICTTKPDKYDRYLADVFLEGDFSQFSAFSSQPRDAPVFLNNALLAAGHATVKKEWEFSDWGV